MQILIESKKKKEKKNGIANNFACIILINKIFQLKTYLLCYQLR